MLDIFKLSIDFLNFFYWFVNDPDNIQSSHDINIIVAGTYYFFM